jgi:hypothetical protein
MREWLMLAVTFAPVVILGLLQRSGVEAPDWIRVVAIGWFVVGALVIGWYDGWVQRALMGVVIFIPLMAAFVWWSGAIPLGWPTALTLLLIAGSVGALVVLSVATGWFTEVRQDFRRAVGRDSGMPRTRDPGPR